MIDKVNEHILGGAALLMTLFGIIAQVEVPTAWQGILTQFGGLGLAVWLVIHHTMVTIPNSQKEFREERQAILKAHQEERAETLAAFNKTLEEKRLAYVAEVDRQRSEFKTMLDQVSSNFKCRV
jgi:hypothetical protein